MAQVWKQRFRSKRLIQDPEIREILRQAIDFEAELGKVKARIAPADFAWYPYDSFGTLSLVDRLLTGRARFPRSLIGTEPVLDLGCGDGALSFFFESLGFRVCAIDYPPANYNGMAGVRKLKAALRSAVRIASVDLDSQFDLPVRRCGLALFFGILYHLKNPLGVLEGLASHARYCFLSTAVARYTPDHRVELERLPVAYLASRDGLKGDETNYWIFSEAGLRLLVDRAGWDVCDWMVTGDADATLWESERDLRVFCLLRSRSFEPAPRTQLLSGWHKLENGAWRWTERRFSVAVEEPGTLALACTMPSVLATPLKLTAHANGCMLSSCVFSAPGDADFRFAAKRGVIKFELDHALAPDAEDGRERGIIVRSVDIS